MDPASLELVGSSLCVPVHGSVPASVLTPDLAGPKRPASPAPANAKAQKKSSGPKESIQSYRGAVEECQPRYASMSAGPASPAGLSGPPTPLETVPDTVHTPVPSIMYVVAQVATQHPKHSQPELAFPPPLATGDPSLASPLYRVRSPLLATHCGYVGVPRPACGARRPPPQAVSAEVQAAEARRLEKAHRGQQHRQYERKLKLKAPRGSRRAHFIRRPRRPISVPSPYGCPAAQDQ